MSNSNGTVESRISSVSNSSIMNSIESSSGSGNQSNPVCLTKYTGKQCLPHLQNCLTRKQNSSEIFISSLIDDQSLVEDSIDTLLYFLDLLIQPSDECRRRVVPFLCIDTFGLCDENGMDYRPIAAECLDIRDNICVCQSGRKLTPCWHLQVCQLYQTALPSAMMDWSAAVTTVSKCEFCFMSSNTMFLQHSHRFLHYHVP